MFRVGPIQPVERPSVQNGGLTDKEVLSFGSHRLTLQLLGLNGLDTHGEFDFSPQC